MDNVKSGYPFCIYKMTGLDGSGNFERGLERS